MDNVLTACCLLLVCSVTLADIVLSNCDETTKRGDGIVCYKVLRIEETFAKATEQCKKNNMNLVTVVSEEENEAIARLMASFILNEIWINMKISMTTWRWKDGSELKEQGCYKGQNLMSLHERKTSDNSFMTCSQTCGGKRYVGLMNSTLCLCGDNFDGTSQKGALCHVRCPPSPEENCGGIEDQRIVAIEGVYSNWLLDQPNNGGDEGESQMCSILDENMFWSDEDCQGSYPAVCEINLSPEYFPTCNSSIRGVHLISANESETCIYITETQTNYFKAVERCANFNGSLLKIPSSEFTDALKIRLQNGSSYWIGATRFKQSWMSGEDVVYTAWQTFNQTSGYGFIKRNDSYKTSQTWNIATESQKKFIVCQSTNASVYFVPSYFASRKSPAAIIPPPTKLVVTAVPTTPSFVPPPADPSSSTVRWKVEETPTAEESVMPRTIRDAIIGGVIGGAVLLAVVAIIVVVFICRSRRPPATKHDVEDSSPSYFFGDEYGTISTRATLPDTTNNSFNSNSDSPPPPYDV